MRTVAVKFPILLSSFCGDIMDPKIEVLDLFLEELGEDRSIEGIENRLRLQKAVYLGQLFGVDLGYRYSWYVRGPYSPPLTQDYYKLAESTAGERSGKVLRPDLAAKLQRARLLLSVPAGVDLGKPHWYELLASLHYLYKVSGLDAGRVRETMAKNKAHLLDWIEHGERSLRMYDLLPNQ
jgi:hypothetical protein